MRSVVCDEPPMGRRFCFEPARAAAEIEPQIEDGLLSGYSKNFNPLAVKLAVRLPSYLSKNFRTEIHG